MSAPKFKNGDRAVMPNGSVGVVVFVWPPDGKRRLEYEYAFAGSGSTHPESDLEIYIEPSAMDRHAEKLRQEFLKLIGVEDD